ncbi:urea carboxylase [Rathayibacter sp. VKM Ac-2856]|uniref:urea carboxylase n=1 Tax=unclassified Rathayibacter TaxID=2609250 RepID=UPI00156352D8|nr:MULTISPECIES: urea carboxylase [unclassified Rathayibacter]NQX05236.1 urea carboxylase [Rathayibacter sp. VKM Ac-2858]NQX20889.1 urea carboxylase [Rathayibacter sp. VKM Ac-2856]
MSFDTLLVANRGEIAVRILRTAKAMGLRTVAVYSDADLGAAHVALADEAVRLGPAPAADSYLRIDRILEAAAQTGAGAIHPGYGFLSENAEFARACAAAGIVFVGPTPEQLEVFGAKHTARDAAERAGVPLLAGTGLLDDADHAAREADRIGYPVMLKATAGGGGIGMRACRDETELRAAWREVRRLAEAGFSSAGVFLERLVERARHVEVQVFGDGAGRVVSLGDRDCSLQRRNQKVVEESPAPDLPDAVRERIAEASRLLCAEAGYRSAGTVEYIYDPVRQEAAFLEVNTRLQVEHPVTESRYGIDLVEWMLRLAQGETAFLDAVPEPSGAAVEARVYAENPDLGNAPSSGTITGLSFPDDVRVDGWIRPGSEVSTSYDPLLAKVIVSGGTREEAWAALGRALAETRVDGIATNVGLLRAIAAEPSVLAAEHSTATLDGLRDTTPRVEVLKGGMLTTVQDATGRLGYWPVGVPPSGPMDALSFRLGNTALGNPESAPGLEITMTGPTLRFHTATRVVVTGAPAPVLLDGAPVAQWEPVAVPAGGVLAIGTAESGMRLYLLVEGGLDIPLVLGSASTFDLGAIGGHAGRALAPGDVLGLRTPEQPNAVAPVPVAERPAFGHAWTLAALEGPHAAPEFFTEDDMAVFYATDWEVHFNSARTGVRLVGPKPHWAREDGGEAGLHPSNIHDTPYAVGAVDYTGDLPILLGPDGPSLGGFTCPASVATGHLWRLGQLRPGDTVRFVPVSAAQAAGLLDAPLAQPEAGRAVVEDQGVLHRRPAHGGDPSLVLRRSGDANLLVEIGDMSLDLASRMRVHAIAEMLEKAALPGVIELTPGIRSLQVHFDPRTTSTDAVAEAVLAAEALLPATADLRVPSRTVHLPLAWDDPSTREAIRRYMAGVRDDAPWCPWNIEFIRRINGLDSVDEVYRTVFEAEYLVLGLGDVYLGAPVATPLDPRHRLVTTKYNPARTWTPQNAVGIGGAYLCIYGMEGPGGYQFVGRTVPIWSTHHQAGAFEAGVPWLLRFFDRIRWYPVEPEELLELRSEMAAGRLPLRIEEGEFGLAEYQEFLAENAESIADFRAVQAGAFGAERAAWEASGEFDREEAVPAPPASSAVEIPAGCEGVEAPFVATVFRIDVAVGEEVAAGQTLLALEAMKMEAPVTAPAAGRVVAVVAEIGAHVAAGTVLVVLETTADSAEEEEAA